MWEANRLKLLSSPYKRKETRYTMKLIWFCALGIGLINAAPTQRDTRNNCGYQACRSTNSSVLNVHIVPHSHDDVGWLKTVDQYYFGSRTNIQRAGVQYIIDSVVSALLQNPERRFIQVESAFYQKWWNTQTEERRNAFRQLVNNGQLEIIGGAWSMNDEAAVHYQSIIDQFTFGLRFVNDTLGECGRTRIGWQIDPFGHSREMASIFSQMGYDGLFFARLDWRDRTTRLTSKTAEMLWQGSSNLGDSSNLFTSILYNHYSAPSGYCFDILCSDDPIIDNINSTEYNYERKVEGFAEFIRRQAQYYKTSNIIITMGDDFNYQDALSYYKNLDKLIEGFNKFEQFYEDKRINVFYSTPTCYVKAVHDEAESRNLDFRLKTDDFFPYASDYHAYWTGYYTSRPTSKRFERQGNNLLQVAKQISSFVNHDEDKLHELQDAIGIMQHHDAITGTEKQHVADDYARIVTSALKDTVDHVNDIFSILLAKDGTQDLNFDSCLLANVSICTTSQSGSFIASIYNPLSRPVTYYARLPVDSGTYSILGPNDETIPFQLLRSIDSFGHLTGTNPAQFELVFAAELPPLGAKLYNVIRTAIDPAASVIPDTSNRRFKIGTETTGFELNPTSGLLQSVTIEGRTIDVRQELMYYVGSRGNNQGFENRASGAYIFRPSTTHPNALSFTSNVSTTTYRGLLVEEVHQNFSNWAKQIIRVYKDTNYIEFDWLVGPIYTDDNEGREVISRFISTLNSGDEFYTDSNGREMLRHKLNFRPTFSYSDEEPVAGNYYPVTSKIVLKDEGNNLEIAVLNDRAQGGSSLRSGELELMLHRRLLDDDAFGVGEALNEMQFGKGLIARGQHYLTFGTSSSSTEGRTSSAAVQKDIAQKKQFEPWVFLSPYTSFWENINHEILGLTRPLQDNVQILTLEPWKSSENTLLLRLEHVFEQYEDPELSQSATVDLTGLFPHFDVISVQEMTLAANQPLSENERLNWIVGEPLENSVLEDSKGRKYEHVKNVQDPTDLLITLAPMQIRTFLLNVNYNNV